MRNPLNLFSPDVLKIISGDDCGKCDVYKLDSISFLFISLTLRDQSLIFSAIFFTASTNSFCPPYANAILRK